MFRVVTRQGVRQITSALSTPFPAQSSAHLPSCLAFMTPCTSFLHTMIPLTPTYTTPCTSSPFSSPTSSLPPSLPPVRFPLPPSAGSRRPSSSHAGVDEEASGATERLKAQLLRTALAHHVPTHGWTRTALGLAARDLHLSPRGRRPPPARSRRSRGIFRRSLHLPPRGRPPGRLPGLPLPPVPRPPPRRRQDPTLHDGAVPRVVAPSAECHRGAREHLHVPATTRFFVGRDASSSVYFYFYFYFAYFESFLAIIAVIIR